jgi:hypothetical protein
MKSNRLYLVIVFVLCATALNACKLPKRATVQPTKTLLPTNTLFPTYTPQLTYTPIPTYTTQPTYTETVIYYVQITPSPTPTPMSGVLVRIRNKTDGPVNLYRFGKSGEIHFLGWLVPNYYGEFRFPDLGEWTIRYCHRDNEGHSYNCKNKNIRVKESGQEFSVP